MNINLKTVKYFKLTQIAELLGEDIDDLSESLDGAFTWGDTDLALVNLPRFLAELEVHEEETIMEALWGIIGTQPEDAAEYYVNFNE
jgi:hypothetical protein